MKRFIGKNTKVINLFGKTMMPGLIDAHSHFGKTACNLAQGFNISPPPFGTVKNIP
jgi:predicted amidohydrolase YtcJ